MDPQIRQLFLSHTSLWGSLPAKKLAVLARDMKYRELANGETLIRQGDEGHSMFLVVEGRLEARLTAQGAKRRTTVLGHLRRGELVAQGSHEELMANSEIYRRIFARYAESDAG